ncbi:hypothetical protein BKA66DRAFT_604424 [Pyrenochaeta sp. MPI-SDFR-AT-0127]|nr:hypothetical protein BKA66DRAFT_604424 [Pyrenochaeta sp. MPI-SDFR-AT-0127]
MPRRSSGPPHFSCKAPPTPPESIRSLCTDSEASFSGPDDESKVTLTYRLESLAEHLFDWTLRITGAVCAILFGVWAPLSYQLQKSGNQSNDEETRRLAKEVERLSMQVQMISTLRVFEFCDAENRKELPACKALSASLHLDSLIARLAPAPESTGSEVSQSSSTVSKQDSQTSMAAGRPRYYFPHHMGRTSTLTVSGGIETAALSHTISIPRPTIVSSDTSSLPSDMSSLSFIIVPSREANLNKWTARQSASSLVIGGYGPQSEPTHSGNTTLPEHLQPTNAIVNGAYGTQNSLSSSTHNAQMKSSLWLEHTSYRETFQRALNGSHILQIVDLFAVPAVLIVAMYTILVKIDGTLRRERQSIVKTSKINRPFGHPSTIMLQQRSREAKQPFLLRMRDQRHLDDQTPGPAPQPMIRFSRVRSFFPSAHSLNRFWILEALSSVFSVALFVVIIVILYKHDGKPYGTASAVSQGDSIKRPGIYPILSFLSAVMRACMLLPVATAIGQLKWSWFQDKRRLIDLERFDEASRGMTGSLWLLWTVKCKHWVAFGAALMILTLPIDALIQNSILMPQRRELNTFPYRKEGMTVTQNNVVATNFDARYTTNTTRLAKTSRYDSYETLIATTEPWATIEMINGITFGMSFMNGLERAISATPVVYCPTGTCEFGRYQNLGVGALCLDRSETVTKTGGESPAWTIPGTDLRLNTSASYTDARMLITANSYTDYDQELFDGIYSPLISRTAMLVDAWEGQAPIGIECILIWLLNTLEAKIDQTTDQALQEEGIYVHWNWTVDDGNKTFKCVPSECWINNRTVTEEQNPTLYQEQCISTVSVNAHHGIQNFILSPQRGLRGNLFSAPDNTTANATDWTPLNNFIANINGLVDRPGSNREIFFVNINQLFTNIAAGMTQVIRLGNIVGADRASRPSYTMGNVYQFIFYYRIAWWRLSLPAVLVFGSVTFVVVTALATRDDLDWRRSNLPLLFHGLTNREKEACGKVLQLAEMESAAEGMQVKLVDTGDGIHLLSGRGWDEYYHADG